MKKILLLILALLLLSMATATQFSPKTKVDVTLQQGSNSVDLSGANIAAHKIDLYARRPVTDALIVYSLGREPTDRFAIPRTAISYFALESKAVVSGMSEAIVHFSVSKDAARSFGPSQVSLFLFDSTKGEWVRLKTTYKGTLANTYQYSASATTLGYFAVALLEEYDVLRDGSVIADAGDLTAQVKTIQALSGSAQANNDAHQDGENIPELHDTLQQRDLSAAVLEQTPAIQAPAQIQQQSQTNAEYTDEPSLLSRLIQNPLYTYGFIGVITLLAISLIVGVYVLQQMRTGKRRSENVQKNDAYDDVERLKKLLEQHTSPTYQPAVEQIAEAPKPKLIATPARAPAAKFDDVDTFLHYDTKINEMERMLKSLETISFTGKNFEQADQIVHNSAQSMSAQLDSLEPQMVRSFIAIARKNGKNNETIINSLLNAGYSESLIRQYLQEV